LRIISGTAKGRKLHTPSNSRIRPTSDRAKEALFNILASHCGTLAGFRILDIFAGTGNLGIEALSRGASQVVFIDNHNESVALIKKNLVLTGFNKNANIINLEALSALNSLEKSSLSFQIIFLDPPYQVGLTEKILKHLSSSSLIDSNSIIVAEFSVKEKIPLVYNELREFDRRVYGDTALSFLSLSVDAED
jgi:16S rRNA (guanine(966)-N(2))-methyltransferase RsmD